MLASDKNIDADTNIPRDGWRGNMFCRLSLKFDCFFFDNSDLIRKFQYERFLSVQENNS